MCGFLVDFRSMGKAEALDCAEIAHRGPDARGVWTSPDGTVWMGHVRLSILDLSPAGAQPMVGGSDGFWGKGALVFNGEIYNHQALRAELAAGYPDAGITWRGTSDTETLLVGLSLEGEAFVPRLRGMFAFVWHVPEERYLLAARTPSGSSRSIIPAARRASPSPPRSARSRTATAPRPPGGSSPPTSNGGPAPRR